MKSAWGGEYRRGRFFHKVVGIPAVTNAGLKILDGVNHPAVRSRLLFWEGWSGADGSSSSLRRTS
jgi:hypothetical protein